MVFPERRSHAAIMPTLSSGMTWNRANLRSTAPRYLHKALHGYYEDHGFRFVRFCSDIAYPSAALFQKSTASLEWIDLPRLKEIPDLLGPLRPVEELLLQPVTRNAANRHDRRTASSLRRLALLAFPPPA